MIAATDPQEFIPGGRQQALCHPGPLEPTVSAHDALADDFLLHTFERVSIVESKPCEWWVLRKTPNMFDKSEKYDDKLETNKSIVPEYCKSNASEHFDESWSCKSVDTNVSNKKKRTSEANVSKFQSKRFSNDSKSSFYTNKVNVGSSERCNNKTLRCKTFPGYMEEELYIKGNVVIWSKGLAYSLDEDPTRKTICSYSTSHPVKHALWCNFYCERPAFISPLVYNEPLPDEPTAKPMSCICVIDAQNLRVFTEDNEDYLSSIPFSVKRVWNTKFGLLLEKESDDALNCKTMRTAAIIFSLAHPLDDVIPVAIKHGTLQLIEDPCIQVVFTSLNPSICMIYDTNTGQHSVYKFKRLSQTEWAETTNKSTNPIHSILTNSCRLKSKLSLWENYKSGLHLTGPSPFSSRAASVASGTSQIPSRSYSPMIGMSRCQTPAMSPMNCASPWLLRTSRLNSLIRSAGSNIESVALDRCSDDGTSTRRYSDPSFCLEHIWTSPQNGLSGPATKTFITDDLTGQSYLCYFIPTKSQLSIVRLDMSNANCLIFGMSTSMGAKDAISITNLHMLAILEHTGNVVLYSGLTVVGKVHIGGVLPQHVPTPYVMQNLKQFNSPFPRRSSLLPTCGSSVPDPRFDEHLLSPVLPTLSSIKNTNILQLSFQPDSYNTIGDSTKVHLNGLRDAIENRITLQYSDGTYYRINLPSLASSKLVESCLNALRETMSRDSTISLLTRWYSTRNAPGPTDLTLEQEWNMFINLIFQLLGYDDDQSIEIFVNHPATPSSEAKRLRQSSLGNESDWNLLQKLDHHKVISKDLSNILGLKASAVTNNVKYAPSELQININSVLFANIRIIHYTLHLLYEELKLNILRRDELLLLAQFLSKISYDLGLSEYELHYWKDFPQYCSMTNTKIRRRISQNNLKNVVHWPCMSDKPDGIFQFLYALVNNEKVLPFPYIQNINSRTRDVVQLWSVYMKTPEMLSDPINLDDLIKHVGPPGFKVNQPVEINTNGLPQTPACLVVQMMTQKGLTNRDLESFPIGVNLLLHDAIWQCRENPPTDWPAESYTLLHRPDLAAQANIIKKKKEESAFKKYMNQNNIQDNLPTITQIEMDQEDGMEDVDSTLLKLRFSEDLRVSEARRLLQSSRPVPVVLVQRPDVSDHDFIEEQEKHLYAICTRTMSLPVGRGMFTMRTTSPVITEPLPVPVLCLTGTAPPRSKTVELSHIDTPPTMNLWPLFHNGVANGLRITPEAHNIDSTWIVFNKPKGNTDSEHAGFLMALGLNGHLKNLAILNTFDYLAKYQEMISVGILLGLSAAHRGSSDTSITKMLSIHVEALLPPTSMELDVPQNVQVASLLGIGLLYQGTAHRHMTEILLTEIGRPPGPEMENSVDRESYSLSAGLALGLVTLKQGGRPSGLADLNVPDTLHYYMVGGNKRPLTGSQKDKYKVPSFQIREGTTVNLDVTAPGATLALGLMYLDSGNKAIADWMSPPDTQYLLDFVRPDFLMLRTLSRALIMWQDIQPTKDWIENQVPDTIRPFCMVKPSPILDIDYEAMNQAYCNIIAGACFAVGLRYAGSADQDAFTTLLQFCHMFTSLTGKSIAELAGKPTIETCLNVVLLSVSMVMAGTGNLEIMRIVRYLRRRVGVSTSAVVTYGSHLAVHMSLGLLFLGGGRCTLSNSPACVAALICAFYPKFPTHSNDNRYHLQAFRHLYVLAVELRLVIPKDIMMGRMCYANIKVVKLDGTSINLRGPGLIPDLSSLFKVCINDERYWPVVFERGRNWEQLQKILSSYGCIEIKQRAGYLSYTEDKQGYRTELAHTLIQSNVIPWDPSSKAIISFSSDATIRNFCNQFLAECKDETLSEAKLRQILTKVAYDCVVKDKLNILPMYVGLVKVLMDLGKSPSSLQIWQFKLAYAQILTKSLSTNLISTEAIISLYQQFERHFNESDLDISDALKSYILGRNLEYKESVLRKLANEVIFYNIPHCCNISTDNYLETVCKLKSMNVSTEAIVRIMNLFMMN